MRSAMIGAALLASAGVAQAGGFGGHGGGHAGYGGGHAGSWARGGGVASSTASAHALASASAAASGRAFGYGRSTGFGAGGAFGRAYGAARGFDGRGRFGWGRGGYGRGFGYGYGAAWPYWGDGYPYDGYEAANYGGDYGDVGYGPEQPYGDSYAQPYAPLTPGYAPRLASRAYAISGEGAYAYGYNGYAETPSLDTSAPAYYGWSGPCGC